MLNCVRYVCLYAIDAHPHITDPVCLFSPCEHDFATGNVHQFAAKANKTCPVWQHYLAFGAADLQALFHLVVWQYTY